MSRITVRLLGGIFLCFTGLAGRTPIEPSSRARAAETLGQLPLSFEPNVGQFGSLAGQEVRFISRGAGYTVLVAGNTALVALERRATGRPTVRFQSTPLQGRFPDRGQRTLEMFRLEFLNANSDPEVVGLEELPGRSNYFYGNDPEQWRKDVPTYARVKVEDVYPGIGLFYYGDHRQLEYDLVVAPGADPRAITLKIETRNSKPETRNPKLEIAANGDLTIGTEGGEIRLHRPVVYQPNGHSNSPFTIQNSEFLNGRYILTADDCIRFEVSGYDRTRPLVIDPVLAYASYLGGNASDLASGVALDSSGNAYVAGYTLSTNFPATSGVPQASNAGGSTYGDAFITKLNSTGTAVVYSTYLGGSNDDVGIGIAVDSSGNAYLAGYTRSSNFPTTSGAFRTTLGGGTCGQSPSTFPCGDAFVTKLNASGSALVYSTYLGGSLDDWGLGIALDSSGSAYVTGYAESIDFPTTSGAYQTTFAGGTCGGVEPCATVFVSKLSANGSALAYSTYLGGDGGRGYGIAVDSSGSAYLTGSTDSAAFPTTSGAFSTTSAGNGDAFVAKLTAGGSGLVYSTYLGGGGADVGTAIALDSSGDAYIAGLTSSSNFPVTSGAFQAVCGGCQKGLHDAFVAKLNPAGAGLVYSTYLGGSDEDLAYGIAIDSPGNAYVTGRTLSTNFPTVNPFQPACGGGCANGLSDAFITELNASASALVYSTYVGGSGNDSAYGIALDSSANTYIVGSTTSTDLVTSSGALARSLAGSFDAFVAKVSPANAPGVSLSALTLSFPSVRVGLSGSAQNIVLRNTGSAPLAISSITVSGDFQETNTCGSSVSAGSSCTLSLTFTPTAVGTRTGTLTITDNAASSPQTVSLTGTGVDEPIASLSTNQLTFASQMVGTTSAAQTVTLSNTGTTALTLSSVAISSNFAESNTCGSSVAAGSSCVFSVTFAPTATGSLSGTLSVTDNAGGSPQVVNLSGTGIAPAVSLSPASLSFSNQLLRTTSAAQQVTLSDTGTASLSISSITANGDFAQTNTCGSTVGVGGSCTINVTFTPTTTGTRSGSVTITDSAAGSPQTISLTGTGLAPAVTLSPTSLTFGNQLVGTTSGAQLLTLTNTGSASLTINGVTVAGDFAQANNCGTSLAAGSNCAISVTFTPTATGARTGSVTISDNAASSPQTISLTGTGAAPAVTLSPTSLSFGNQLVGTTSAPQQVTLTNTGTATLSISGFATSGGFAETNSCGSGVSPGASCAISVTFAPTATGTRSGSVTITDSAAGSPQTISLTGTGVAPAVTLSPTSLTFGNQLVGTTSGAQLLTLTNTGSASLTINGVTVAGDFAQANNCGTSLAAGSNCAISVTFTPTATGARTGSVTISDNAASSPQTISLTGTGAAPAVTLSPTSLNFGNDGVGTSSAPRTMTLTNSGTANLTMTSVAISGDFTQSNTCGPNLAAGTSCTISVIFKPSALGVRSGTLTLTDNASGSPQNFPLSGTGVVAYLLSSNATSVRIIKGNDSAQFTISAATSFGFTGNIALACSADPAASCQATPGSITPGQSSTLAVTNLKAIAGNSVAVTVTGTAGPQSASLTLTVLLADFSLTASPTESTVPAGQAASYEVTFTPLSGFDQTISMACGAMPPASTCSFSASTVTLDGSNPSKLTVTVRTTARARGGGRPSAPPGWLGMIFLVFVLAWGLFEGFAGSVRLLPVGRLVLIKLRVALLLSLVAFAAACGGGGGLASAPAPPAGTPTGSYSITFTGAFADTSGSSPVTLTHGATATLVVS